MGTPKGSKKRFWSDDEKRSICLQTRAPGVSVAQVARCYAMNTNLIHKWLKDPRFAPVVQSETAVTTATEDAVFLPVEVGEYRKVWAIMQPFRFRTKVSTPDAIARTWRAGCHRELWFGFAA